MEIAGERKAGSSGFVFRLFVTGDEPHSVRARENLRKFCESHLHESYEIEVIDVLKSFEIALKNRVFLTPALFVLSPPPAVTVFGDLSDTPELIKLLRVGGDE